ncbi:MAG: hypothetical protein ABIX01_02360 [Chitinophagaceae bacterium]
MPWVYNKKIVFIGVLHFLTIPVAALSQPPAGHFKIIVFYTGKNDPLHVSFVHEANRWFLQMSAANNFEYDSTND